MASGIDERTKVPLFAALGTLPFIVGACMWLWNVDAKASASLKATKTLKKSIWRIERSLVRLEFKAGTLPDKQEVEPEDEEQQ